ncbi:hypothetical protein KIPB_013720, partial [Kipferlia bialata]
SEYGLGSSITASLSLRSGGGVLIATELPSVTASLDGGSATTLVYSGGSYSVSVPIPITANTGTHELK